MLQILKEKNFLVYSLYMHPLQGTEMLPKLGFGDEIIFI